jgi:hypothetical protein
VPEPQSKFTFEPCIVFLNQRIEDGAEAESFFFPKQEAELKFHEKVADPQKLYQTQFYYNMFVLFTLFA